MWEKTNRRKTRRRQRGYSWISFFKKAQTLTWMILVALRHTLLVYMVNTKKKNKKKISLYALCRLKKQTKPKFEKNWQKKTFWVFLIIDDSYCVVSLACTFRCSSHLATDSSWVFNHLISLLSFSFVFRVVLVLSRIISPHFFLWFNFHLHTRPISLYLSLSLSI